MTDDEKKRQKGEVLVDNQDTEAHLGQLRVKAQRMGDLLTTFGKWLSGSPEINIYRAGQANFDFNVEATATEYILALNPNQYFELANEIRETTAKLRRLEAMKQNLGLK